MNRILVSACLLGEIVRYNGQRPTPLPRFPNEWQTAGRIIPFCPETAGGLPVPRPPAELAGCMGDDVICGRGRVVDINGVDVTAAFLAGARAAAAAARDGGAVAAVLKEGSPSCGTGRVYDGSFSGRRCPGRGVAAALLVENKVAVFSEEQIKALISFMTALKGPPEG